MAINSTPKELIAVPTGAAQGDVIYFNGTNWTRLAAATTVGQVLISGGAGANPSWQNVGQKTFVTLTATQALTSTAYVNVTSMSFTLAINRTYRFKFVIITTANVSTEGSNWKPVHPGTPTAVATYFQHELTFTTFVGDANVTQSPASTVASSNGATPVYHIIEGTVATGASGNGTLQLQAATETGGANSTTIQIGSWAELEITA